MSTFLFLLLLAVSGTVTAVSLHEIKCDIRREESDNKKLKSIRALSRGAAVLLAFIAAAEAFGLIRPQVYKGAYVLLGGAAAFSMLVCTLNKKRRYHAAAALVKAVLIAAVLEATIFNIPTYRLWLGSYGQMDFTAEEFAKSGSAELRPVTNDITVTKSHVSTFTFDGMDEEIADVFVDIGFEKGTKSAILKIDSMDETNTVNYRDCVAEGILIKGKPHSHYTQLHLSGKVSSLKLTITPENDGTVYIKGISFNKQIPMSISWIRVFLIIFGMTFWHLLMHSKTMQKSYSKSKNVCRTAAIFITDLICLAVILTTFAKLDNYSIIDIMKCDSGDQMTQELVDAFESGSTSLLEKPSAELNVSFNPYSTDLLNSKGISYSWDHVYYEGNYYSYYGIAPVVLVFLPYHLITGYYFPESMAVMLFALIGIIGLTKLYMEFIKKLFPKAPAGHVIAGLIIIHITSGIWFSVGRPEFYEIALSAGFAVLTWAVYFFFSANIIGDKKISLPRTAIASTLFAIAVLSRPTLVLYCIAAAVLLLMALPKAASDGKADKKSKLFNAAGVRYLLCAMLPMVCIGLVQMWYNYDRFGNPFEFGIQYSLTINDFTRTQFHPRLSLVAIYNYFFNPPIFVPGAPGVKTDFQYLNNGGYFYSDDVCTGNTSGIFFIALPMFAYLFSGKALKLIRGRRNKLRKAVCVGLPCVIIPFVIVASVWESGYASRYMSDIAWQSLLGAFAVFFFLYGRISDPTKKKLANGFMWFAMMWALVVGGVQEFNQMFRYDYFYKDFPEMSFEIQRLFAFWT
ncbi:hypothetical protein [Ruminococcus sp.]|uniref:hypothetical protein n=1 Tax=Ruminococcus sp. TaxID=41978 RepID=UPI0025F8E4C3|nr:hypothetical protein [Ruminococcus sp.]MBR1431713.1 hypothetical protein [Ruminococcus sp.]